MSKISVISVFTGVLILIGFSTSCKHENLPYINGDSICFERDVLPIFVSKCAMTGCHDANTKAEGLDLSNYTAILKRGVKAGDPDNSKVWESINEGEMPPQGYSLTSYQKSMIRTWIAYGAKNGINCTVKCDSNTFTYSGAIAPIMNTGCTGCHSGTNPSAGVDLSSHAGVKTVATNGRLMGSVQQLSDLASMPPYGSPKLTSCQIAQIRKWIQNGCLND